VTSDAPAPRPRQVTFAASLVMAGSILLVVSVFERLGDLRSLESRTSIQKFLSEPPGSDLGLSLEAVIDLLRVAAMVGAALATAAAILGYHVLKRNRAARIGLAVLAVPLFLAGSATGGFLAAFVAASIAMLWLPPARAWFTGEPNAAASPAQPAAESPTLPAAPTSPPQQVSSAPPPWPGYGEARTWTPPPSGAAPVRPAPASGRPGAVVAACVITWLCCALASVIGVLLLAVLAVDTDGLFTELHRQNPQLGEDVSDATLETVTWVTAIVCVVWSLASSGLAVLAFRRVRWAAYGLAVSAGLVAVLCLAGSVASPVLAVPGVLAAAAAVLLLQGRAHRWYTTRKEPWRPSS
jgi:hypothetical protein